MFKLPTAVFAGAMIAAATAQAQVQVLTATEDPAKESSFTLTFTDFQLDSSANIISTDFDLEIDADAGTARFTSYLQEIEPLTLPGPTQEGISTGDLTVRIVPGSSSGTYNPNTGEFSTSEQYEISFTGDLSAFGITSPVTLPSSSTGTVVNQNGSRTIEMSWAGVGQLANPLQPGTPLNFNYTCRVNTVYSVASVGLGIFSQLCANGTVSLLPMTLLGLWFMKCRFHRRRA